jgi:hypothetical protein
MKTDTQCWFEALREWVNEDFRNRSTMKVGDIPLNQLSVILQAAQRIKGDSKCFDGYMKGEQ